MRRFIPAGFEARNGVLIALLGLCLRSRHISATSNGDVVDYSELLKKKKPQRSSSSPSSSPFESRSDSSRVESVTHHKDNEQRERRRAGE